MSGGPLQRIGFIGIGRMGWPMAANLVRAGFALRVADRAPGRAEAFAAATGAEAAPDIRTAAAGCDAVITMLPTSAEVAAVIEAIMPILMPGMLVIDMTSGQPACTRALAARLASAGVAMVDCPVSGGVARAQSGELALMAGGEAAALDRAEPLLRALGTSLHRCGPIGAGQAMKALNNMASAAGFLISVEVLLIGSRFGLDPATMVDVLNASTGMNNATQRKLKQFVLSRRFDAGFALGLMVKDLTIAMEIARETATPAPLAALCRELWAAGARLVGDDADHTAQARLYEQLAGSELRGNGP